MSSRTFNKLAATTALVSAAIVLPQAGFAQTAVTTALTATQATTGVAGGYNVTTGGSINVPGAAAVNFNSVTASENALTIGAGRTVTSASAATLTSSDDDDYTVVNNGILSNTNGTPVIIDATGGSVSGNITNNGTMTGAVTMGDVADSLTLGGDSVTTGDIYMGNGANQIFVQDGATVTGSIGGGDDGDSLTIYGGTIGGDPTFDSIDLGNGVNSIMFGEGEATIDLDIYNGGDITITNGAEVIFNGGNTGAAAFDDLDIQNGTTFTANAALNGSDELTLDGRLVIGANATATFDTLSAAAGADSALTFGVDGNSAGQLVIATGTNDFSTTDFSVVIADGAAVTDGTTYTLVDGDDTTTLGTLLTTSQGLYTFELDGINGGDDIELTINRAGIDEVVTGGSAGAAAAVLEALGTNGAPELDTVFNNLGTATDTTAAVESLLPAVDGAVYTTIVDNQNTVLDNMSDRLANLRTGMAAGDKSADRNMWVKGFGQVADHDGNNGNRGYDSDTVGATFGVDKSVKGGNFGLAFTYADSNVDSDSANNASTEVSNYQLSAYGNRGLNDGLFLNWMGSVGYNDIETNRTINVGGFDRAVEGDTTGIQVSAKVELGKDFKQGSAILTPLAGLQYTMIKNRDYTETGAGGASLNVEQDAMHIVNLSTGVRSTWEHKTAGGTTIKPHLTGMLQYNLGDDQADVTSQFTGGGAAFETNGVEMNRFGVNLGTGVTWQMTNGVDLTASYDADLRQDYTSHNAFVKARWAF